MTATAFFQRAKDRYETARKLFPIGHPRRLVLHALYRRALKRLDQERAVS